MTNFADLTFFGHNHPASFIVIHDHFILATLLLLSTNFSIVKIVNHHRNHRCYFSQEIQEVEPPNGRREDGPHGIQTTHVSASVRISKDHSQLKASGDGECQRPNHHEIVKNHDNGHCKNHNNIIQTSTITCLHSDSSVRRTRLDLFWPRDGLEEELWLGVPSNEPHPTNSDAHFLTFRILS